jgi:hypothetical protein
MVKSMSYQIAPCAAERTGAGSLEQIVDWTLGPSSDRERGNACIGIAIGCALSAPIWAGLALFVFLLA